MGQTTNYNLPYPESTDTANVPADMRLLAESTDTVLGEIEQELEKFEGGKVLWTGAWFMNQNQQAILSENISDQNNGIVLIWSPYQNGQAQNWGYYHTFISKYQLQLEGRGVNCIMATNNFSAICGKYIYIYDSYISGNSENENTGTASGITYKNNAFVLRAIVGI